MRAGRVDLAHLARHRAAALVGSVGLAVAVALRVHLAGANGAQSPVAGIWFAAVLTVLAYCTRDARHHAGTARLRPIAIGFAGAGVLCVPAAVRHLASPTWVAPVDGYLFWALIVTTVAVAEEALLRGSLFTSLERHHGTPIAIAATSIAFALLHAPVYGWGVVPLDFAVGVWLGTLRVAAGGSVIAPAIAHTIADLAGWWLR